MRGPKISFAKSAKHLKKNKLNLEKQALNQSTHSWLDTLENFKTTFTKHTLHPLPTTPWKSSVKFSSFSCICCKVLDTSSIQLSWFFRASCRSWPASYPSYHRWSYGHQWGLSPKPRSKKVILGLIEFETYLRLVQYEGGTWVLKCSEWVRNKWLL